MHHKPRKPRHQTTCFCKCHKWRGFKNKLSNQLRQEKKARVSEKEQRREVAD